MMPPKMVTEEESKLLNAPCQNENLNLILFN
jgi:hypothetical protein